MTAFDPWDPFRDLRFAGTREHPEHGTCFIAEGRILVEDLLEAARAGRVKVISVAATTSAAAEIRDRLPLGTELLTAEPSVTLLPCLAITSGMLKALAVISANGIPLVSMVKI